jgi:hypothetical protein
MTLPGLAHVGRMLAHGAAASSNQRIRVDWNRFQNRLKCNTLRLCFADAPQAAHRLKKLPFDYSRILIDGIIGIFSVASATILCVGVPIVLFRPQGVATASTLTPWATLNQIQEVIVSQALSGSLFRNISLACLASAGFIIEASLGCPRLAMMVLLPNINGIVPHKAIARAQPMPRLLARIAGVCYSQILRAAFCFSCFPTKPSLANVVRAVLSPLPQRLRSVFFFELGRLLLHMYPAVSQFIVRNFQAPPEIDNEELDDMPDDELPPIADRVHHLLARSGLVFHSAHLSIAPTEFIHERIVSYSLFNPFVFTSELRSWYTLLQVFRFSEDEFPGFFKRLLLGYWFSGCAEMLQNGCIVLSLAFNELAAYFWGGEEPRIAAGAPQL